MCAPSPRMRKDVLLWIEMSRFRIIAIVAAILIGCGMLYVLYFNNPETAVWYPSCIFHKYTGLHCAGCGNTRAAYYLLHGNIRKSLACNIMLIPYMLLFLCIIFKPKWLDNSISVWAIPGVIVAFTVLRNVSWTPFFLLAPH